MKLVISLLCIMGTAHASGDGHGSPADLISSFVNLGLLITFLVWKLRAPLRGMFSKKSESIKSLMQRADIKAKEVEMMMQMQQKKSDGVAGEISKINVNTEKFISKFEADYTSEVEERIATLKADATQKIEAEKKQMIDELNSSLLDEVIAKTKAALKSDKALSDNVSKNLIEGLK